MEPPVQCSKENYSKVMGVLWNTVVFLPLSRKTHMLHGQHLLFSGHSVQLSSLWEMVTFTTITRQLSWLLATVGPMSKWLPSGRTSAQPLGGLWMQQHAHREDIALCPLGEENALHFFPCKRQTVRVTQRGAFHCGCDPLWPSGSETLTICLECTWWEHGLNSQTEWVPILAASLYHVTLGQVI